MDGAVGIAQGHVWWVLRGIEVPMLLLCVMWCRVVSCGVAHATWVHVMHTLRLSCTHSNSLETEPPVHT